MSQASKLTNEVINFIYCQGGYAWRAQSAGVYDRRIQSYRTAPKKGVADVLGIFRGKFLAIEIKIGKDRLSDVQEGFLKNVEHAGGLTFVAKDSKSFQEWWKKNLSTV